MCMHQTGTVPCFAAPTTTLLDHLGARTQDAEAKGPLTVVLNASISACRVIFQSIISIKMSACKDTRGLDGAGLIRLDDGALQIQESWLLQLTLSLKAPRRADERPWRSGPPPRK